LKQQKNAHRAASGWIVQTELQKTGSNPAVENAVFSEVQCLLREQSGKAEDSAQA